MIDQERIDAVKAGADLVGVIESRGIALKKNGKGYMGLCPFHKDTAPSLSVTPEKGLWQCFGCGAGGDVIRFVEMFDRISFPEAVVCLDKAKPPPGSKRTDKAAPPGKKLTVKDRKLLARVVEYYQHTMSKDPRGLDYLKNERGITNHQSIRDFGTGYADGTLKDILPEDPDVISALKLIGVLNEKGREVFQNCVVFPLYGENGDVAGLYGRNIRENARVRHRYLPGPRTGLVNRKAASAESLFLTESVIDALTLYDRGFLNVMPIYGVNGLTDAHLSLIGRKISTVYLVFDADDAGKKAAAAVSLQLKEKGVSPYIVDLPEKDVNIYFRRHSKDAFKALITAVDPGEENRGLYKETAYGFIAGFGERRYEIKGIHRGDTQLKITVKAFLTETCEPFELSTIDLYSSRSRIGFARLCSDLFGVENDRVKADLGRILNMAEAFAARDRKEAPPAPSDEEKENALQMLKNPDMFAEILSDFETLGVTGEENNKLVGYLTAVSRKLDDPLSALIQSRSAAGKSTLQDAVLSLVPPEDYVKYTRITDQALFYKEEDALVHKLIAIEEEVGMGGAAYSIRNIQSSKKITVAATGKDPGTGKMRTEEYTVKGPVAVMITTTAAEVEGETASRFLCLSIDESAEMTGAIHAMQREAETLAGLIRQKKTEHIVKKHHTAQRLLKPVAVINPFTPYLSYPSQSIRTRRDHKKYLGLIRTIAYLHQYQRKTKTVMVEGRQVAYIEATLEDIDRANGLADPVLGQSLDDLAPPSKTLLDGILAMAKQPEKTQKTHTGEIGFNRRMIREHMGWSDWQIKVHIKQLEELEYIWVRMGARGKEYVYALNYKGQGRDKSRFYLNLTPISEIKKRMKQKKSGH